MSCFYNKTQFKILSIRTEKPGKVIFGQFKVRLDPTDIDPAQREKKRANYDKVTSFRKPLLSCTSIQELTKLAENQLKELFKADRVLLAEKNDPEFNWLNGLIEASLRENRILYIPDTKSTGIIFNGQVPGELDHLFSADIGYFEIDPSAINDLSYGSLVVVPLVSGLDEIRPVHEYKRHGIIVLYFREDDVLDPLSDLGPLGMYAEFLAAAMNSLDLSFQIESTF